MSSWHLPELLSSCIIVEKPVKWYTCSVSSSHLLHSETPLCWHAQFVAHWGVHPRILQELAERFGEFLRTSGDGLQLGQISGQGDGSTQIFPHKGWGWTVANRIGHWNLRWCRFYADFCWSWSRAYDVWRCMTLYDVVWRCMMLYLVGGIPTPLKNMTSSVGVIIPNIWEKKHVPNHQPGMIRYDVLGSARYSSSDASTALGHQDHQIVGAIWSQILRSQWLHSLRPLGWRHSTSRVAPMNFWWLYLCHSNWSTIQKFLQQKMQKKKLKISGWDVHWSGFWNFDSSFLAFDPA